MQGCHRQGKPGKVREFKKVRENREKSGKKAEKRRKSGKNPHELGFVVLHLHFTFETFKIGTIEKLRPRVLFGSGDF